MFYTIQLSNGMVYTSTTLDGAMRETGLLTKAGRLTFEQSLARLKKNHASLYVRRQTSHDMTLIQSRDEMNKFIEENSASQDAPNHRKSNDLPQEESLTAPQAPQSTTKNQQPMTLKEKLEKLQQQLQDGPTSNGKAGKNQLEEQQYELERDIEDIESEMSSLEESMNEAEDKLKDLAKQEQSLKDLGLWDDPTFEPGRKMFQDKLDSAEQQMQESTDRMKEAQASLEGAQKTLENVKKQLEAADEEPEQSNEADPFEGVTADVSLEHPMQSVLIRRCKAVRIAHSMNQDALYPMLVGPAGSGKTTAARKVAIELFGEEAIMNGKFGMLSMNEETERSEGFGFISPIDKLYKSTDFRRIYEEGGVFLLDEVDASNANALTAMNAAISAPYASFPDGMVRRHKDFVLIAAANTFGNGADGLYVGRNELDAATRDRFMTMTWDYNWDSIRVARPNFTAVTDLIQSLSEACQKIQMQHVISPRSALFAPFMLLMGDSLEEVLDACVFKGLPKEDSDNLLGMVGVSRGDLANVAK